MSEPRYNGGHGTHIKQVTSLVVDLEFYVNYLVSIVMVPLDCMHYSHRS